MNVGDYCIQSGLLAKKVNNNSKWNGITAIYSDWNIGLPLDSKPIEIYSLTQLINQIINELNIHHSLREVSLKEKYFYRGALEWFANLT